MLPLPNIEPGCTFRIQCFGCDEHQARELRNMGCREGICCKLLSSSNQIIMKIDDTRLALDHTVACKIL